MKDEDVKAIKDGLANHAKIGAHTNELLTALLKFHAESPRVNFDGIKGEKGDAGPAGKDANEAKIAEGVINHVLKFIPKAEDIVGPVGRDIAVQKVAPHVIPLVVKHLSENPDFAARVKGLTGDRGPEGPIGKGEKGDVGPQGPAGPNGSKDTAKDIVKKLKSLPEGQRLHLDDIDGVPVKSRRNDLGYLRELSDVALGTTDPADGYLLAWSKAQRKFVPVAPGSSGGVAFQGLQELSTTAPNSSTQVFPFAHAIGLLAYNGQLQFLGTDYTVSGQTATFKTIVPQTGDTVSNIYA